MELVFLLLFWAHVMADLSSHVIFKVSKNNATVEYITYHTLTYIFVLSFIGFLIPINWSWLIFNFIFHLIGDIKTSKRLGKYFIKLHQSQKNLSIKTIPVGIMTVDQLTHLVLLMASYWFMVM